MRLVLLLPLAFAFFLTGVGNLRATEQEPDTIKIDGAQCELETHWMFPTPLEAYYRDGSRGFYPFTSDNTGNYRGHVAGWEVSAGRLYLTSVTTSKLAESEDGNLVGTIENYPLRKLFPGMVDSEGRVPADWFSGNLRVFGKPITRIEKNPYDEEPVRVPGFAEITLLQIKDGQVVRKTTFPFDEYWKKFDIVRDYRGVPENEADAIREHIASLDRQSGDWENIGSIDPQGPMTSEKDFSVFLTRYSTQAVNIPLTRFAIVSGATVDTRGFGWAIDQDLRLAPGQALLACEMNSTDVPAGPWSNHVAGSVQILIRLESLKDQSISFSEKSQDIVKIINNVGGVDVTKYFADGSLDISGTGNSEAHITGKITLRTQHPSTYQQIDLSNAKVPVLGVKEYVERYTPPGDATGYFTAAAIYQRIVDWTEKEKLKQPGKKK